jgi:AcrR family transcriptional regulator
MVNESPMSERRLALRDALIASATRVIAERGYQALRARDLAKDVGCALGAIYGVFPDLDALVFAVNTRTLDDLDAEIARRFAAPESGAPAPATGAGAAKRDLLLLAKAYFAFASEHAGRWRALFEHRTAANSVPETYVARLESIFGNIERPLETLMPTASRGERRLFARTLFCAVHGIVSLGLDQKLGVLSPDMVAWQMRALVEAAALGAADHPDVVRMAHLA